MISKKKCKGKILTLLLFCTAAIQCLVPALGVLANTVPAPPIVNAESVYIMEARTGDELYSKLSEEPIFTDSLLPMLMSLVVVDERGLDDFILISEEAEGMNTRITGHRGDTGLIAGERLTVRQLLSAVILANSQDAAQALAESMEGEAAFLEKIRRKAEELQLTGTVIESYLVGEDSGHTTARDMARTMQAFLNHSQLMSLAQLPTNTFVPNNMVPEPRIIENSNVQIDPEHEMYLENALAGFLAEGTLTAGNYNSFVSALENGNSQFIVAMSDSDRAMDNFSNSRVLFDWAGNNYRSVHLIDEGETLSFLPLENGSNLELLAARDVYFLAPRVMTSDPDFSLNFKPLETPSQAIVAGQIMGTADIVVAERVIATLDLLAESTVNLTLMEEEPPEEALGIQILRWALLVLLIILALGIVLLIIRTINKIRRTRKKIQRIRLKQDKLRQESAEESIAADHSEADCIMEKNSDEDRFAADGFDDDE